MQFKDHFSGHASDYARFRPRYPDTLYEWLATLVPADACVWDCACGSGQATRQLGRYFPRVIATDASTQQIEAASAPAHVEFRVAAAEDSGLVAASIDLICVAQALHWFAEDRFFAEARRVARPDAILAVWTYGSVRVEGIPDDLLHAFEHDVVGNWWPPERRAIDEGYAGYTLPGAGLAAPGISMTADWPLESLLGYVESWSAVRRYRRANGTDPLPALGQSLAACWGNRDASRVVRWPLVILASRL